MDFVDKLENPTKLLGVVALLCLGKLVYDHMQKNGNKLVFMLVLGLLSLLYMYIVNCVARGNCGILSWILAIVFILQLVAFTGIVGMKVDSAADFIKSKLQLVGKQ
jgi:hypothetical protein